MKKVLIFAVLVLAIGLHFSCTSEIESAEDILGKESSSSLPSDLSSSSLEEVLSSSSSDLIVLSSSSDLIVLSSSSDLVVLSSSSDLVVLSSSSILIVQSSSSMQAGTFFCRYPNGCSPSPVSSDVCTSLGGRPVQSCDLIISGNIVCNWPILPNSSGNKYIPVGADIPDCDVSSISIENNVSDELNCSGVTYEKEGSTSAAGKIHGRAVAICNGSKVILKEYEADVVGDPAIVCSWEKAIVAKGQIATPKATISNDYGRCSDVAFSDGFPREVTEAEIGIVNVTAGVSCNGFGAITKACPALEVKNAIYTMKNTNERVTLPNEPTVIEMDLPSNWYYDSNNFATFSCEVVRGNGDGGFSGKIGGSVSISGSDFATAQIPVAWTIDKYLLQVDLKCNDSCRCRIW